MAVEDTTDASDTGPGFDPDMYVDDLPVWPPPHWADPSQPQQIVVVDPAAPIVGGIGAHVPTPPPPPPPPKPTPQAPAGGGDMYMHGPRGSQNRHLAEQVAPVDEVPVGNAPPVLVPLHPDVAAALAPPPVDAITGGVTSDQARAPGVAELAPDAVTGVDAVSPEAQGDVDRAQRLGTDVGTASTERNIEQMSPEDQVRLEAAREAERDRLLRAQALQAVKDQQDREKAAADVHARLVAQMQAQEAQDRAEAQRLAQTKIETNPGIGHMILGAIAGFVGGMASPFTGGRNLAVESFQRSLGNWIDAQKTELMNKRDLLGKSMAQTADQIARENDAYRQGEVLRAAVYERAIQRAQAEAQNYDPQGTTAQRIADGVAQLKAKQAADWQAAQQTNFDNNLKLHKAQLDESQFVETTRHNRTEEGVSYENAATSRMTAENEARKLDAEQQDRGTQKAQQAADKAQADYDKIVQQGVMVPTGKTVTVDGKPIPEMKPAVQQDGKPFVMAPEVAKDFQPIKAGTFEALDALNKLRLLRKGFDTADQAASKIGSSEEGRALVQEGARMIVGLHKASGVNRFSPEIVTLMTKAATGGLDPDSMRAMMNELDRARDEVVDTYNGELRARNYTGARVDVPDPLKAPAPPERPEQTQLRAIENDVPKTARPGDPAYDSAKQAIVDWGSAAKAGDKDALENLRRATNANNEILAAFANHYLTEAQFSDKTQQGAPAAPAAPPPNPAVPHVSYFDNH